MRRITKTADDDKRAQNAGVFTPLSIFINDLTSAANHLPCSLIKIYLQKLNLITSRSFNG
jgi:hypothetical protein